jgi:prepilin-type N-terminal cleavage/methylation domain-containing protein
MALAPLEGMTGRRRSAEHGLTLIELLVVIGIVALLAAIAISQYALYKQKSVDSLMESTLHEARQAIESYYVNNHTYSGATETILRNSYGYLPAAGVTLSINPPPTDTAYSLMVCATGGTSAAFVYSSLGGVMTPSGGPCT